LMHRQSTAGIASSVANDLLIREHAVPWQGDRAWRKAVVSRS
jgi:hypothetical protein